MEGSLLLDSASLPRSPRIAFLFPGQGSQSLGMGKLFFETDSEVVDLFKSASTVLGFDISDLCFNGPDDQLNLTENTQPAILTVSIAILHSLTRRGITPAVVAGHSLGEWSAVVAAGGMDFLDAVQLVKKRGRYMQEAAHSGHGVVAAVLGVPKDLILKSCIEASSYGIVCPANFNTSRQVVIAGETVAVEVAIRLIQEQHKGRIVRLPISVPVHTPLMVEAANRLEVDLSSVALQDLEVPLIANVNAQSIRLSGDVRHSLLAQLPSAVLWEESMKTLISLGIDFVIEIGPGSVLSRLMKTIDSHVKTFAVNDPESLNLIVDTIFQS